MSGSLVVWLSGAHLAIQSRIENGLAMLETDRQEQLDRLALPARGTRVIAFISDAFRQPRCGPEPRFG